MDDLLLKKEGNGVLGGVLGLKGGLIIALSLSSHNKYFIVPGGAE